MNDDDDDEQIDEKLSTKNIRRVSSSGEGRTNQVGIRAESNRIEPTRMIVDDGYGW